GGRDLYASPDGSVYLRKNDGWYQRKAGGQWQFAAPTQARVERDQAAAARGAGQVGGGAGYRLVEAGGGGLGGRLGRVHDTGVEPRAAEIAALEREYYARSLAQFRAQNWQGSGDYSRRARSGRRRR